MKNEICTSIIIPNRNNAARLRACLEGVMANVAGREDVEVIVVDNGSTDESVAVAEGFPVRVLSETGMRSPYPARNRGIQNSSGNDLALLDANCEPVSGWLRAGEEELASGADLVGGPLLFEATANGDWLARFDQLYAGIRPEDLGERTSLPGGNLFVRREAFTAVGLFIPNIRSLGDIEWTNRAHAAGFVLGWAEGAQVRYPAKTGAAFRKKMVRLGRGKKELFRYHGGRVWSVRWALRIAKGFLPPNPAFYRRMQSLNRREKTGIPSLVLFLLCWYTKVLRAWGMLWGRCHPEIGRRQPPRLP